MQQTTGTRQQGLAQFAVLGLSVPLRIVCAPLDVGDARCCMCLLHCRFHINIENGNAKLEALKALKYNPGFNLIGPI